MGFGVLPPIREEQVDKKMGTELQTGVGISLKNPALT